MTKPEDIITFGKYKGKSFNEIAEIEPSYILWLHENVDSIKFSKKWLDLVEWDAREQEEALFDAWSEWYARYS